MCRQICYLLILLFAISAQPTYAQRLGLLPPSVKWKQLVDDSLRILYPEGYEENANRVASLMLKFASLDPISKDGRYKPISVLLQPHTNISNAYVGLAPYVSEFYLQPHENPFQLGSLPWDDFLAVHEYRHVQQLNAANRGISHVVKVIFGELAFTGLYNLAVPNWFREGDAVYAETKWTLQGRGRLSHFTLPFRMKLLEGDTWNYYTVRNGSYREFTPDHYPLGYLLVQYGNHLFGENTWDSIITEAPLFRHLFGPFSGAVKQRTGYRNKHLYQQAMSWYQERWKEMKEPDIEYENVPLPDNDFRNSYFDMTYPDVDEDGTLYAAITTFDRTTAIYKITSDGKRHKVISMGLQQDSYFDQSFHRLTWTEIRYDPRWLRRDKNVIVVYDQTAASKLTIEPEKGYFTPCLDQRSVRIVALHADEKGQYNLQILDARSGALLTELPNPENLYLGYPTWTEDEKWIIATARNKAGEMALVMQDVASGEFRQLTHYSYHVLGRPRVHDHWILITATLDELDQVYAVDRGEGIFYQVSDGNKAHYDPVWNPVSEEIICAEYTLQGKKLVTVPADDQRQWKLKNLNNGIKPVAGSEYNLLDANPQPRKFDSKDYSPWFNALNFHSWTVTADDPVWGAEARSNNILNNITLAAGYQYNRTSQARGPYLNMRFGMWYPVINFGFSRASKEISGSDGSQFRASNNSVDLGLELPLFFNSGIYQQLVNLSSTYNAGISKIRPLPSNIRDFNFDYVRHGLVFINSRLRAYRQAMPTWGFRTDILYSHEVRFDQISQLYLSGDLALPGMMPSHYLHVRGELLSQDTRQGSIILSSPYAGARGFDIEIAKTQYRGGITYGFPFLYPDVGIGNIFYTRRIRLQPFFDVAYTNAENAKSQWMRSTGIEAIIDFDFPPISIGLRYARLLDGFNGGANKFEIFLPSERF